MLKKLRREFAALHLEQEKTENAINNISNALQKEFDDVLPEEILATYNKHDIYPVGIELNYNYKAGQYKLTLNTDMLLMYDLNNNTQHREPIREKISRIGEYPHGTGLLDKKDTLRSTENGRDQWVCSSLSEIVDQLNTNFLSPENKIRNVTDPVKPDNHMAIFIA